MERAAESAARRLRINGALDALVRWSPLPLLIAVGALTYVKVTPPGGLGPGTRGVIVSCLGLAVLTTLVAPAAMEGGPAEVAALVTGVLIALAGGGMMPLFLSSAAVLILLRNIL